MFGQQSGNQNSKNLILAIVLSVAIILFFQVYFSPAPQKKTDTANPPQTTQPGTPGTPGTAPPTNLTKADALKQSDRVAIEGKRIRGSISLTGGVIDDVTLKDYRTEVKKTSPPVDLLKPRGMKGAYYVHQGWVLPQGAKPVDLPTEQTKWTAEGGPLAPGKPVTLSWTGSDGLKFTRRYEVDDNYFITVTDKVENTGGAEVTLSPYAATRIVGEPTTLGFFILHEGPIGVFRSKPDGGAVITDPSYGDVKKAGSVNGRSIGGWIGFTDHYWLVALVPDQKKNFDTAFQHAKAGDVFDARIVGEAVKIAPGGSTEWMQRVFAGAKEVDVLRAYQDGLGIEKFDWAIDFGWFWFFTKPFLLAIKAIAGWVGNFGIAILILTIIVKIVFFPLANKSYKSMSQMKKLQPEMQRIREQFTHDKQQMNRELMDLYRKEKINPAAGCWPVLLQIPVFFALYKVLFISIEMRHAPFFGWIQDLSAKDPTSILNLFGLLPWGLPAAGSLFDLANIGIWPIIMGVTMWLQHRLNPTPPDPVQQKIFALMPWIFTVMLASFPAGLVIYWAWNNVLSIGQQYLIMRKYGRPAADPVSAKGAPRNVKDLKAWQEEQQKRKGAQDDKKA